MVNTTTETTTVCSVILTALSVKAHLITVFSVRRATSFNTINAVVLEASGRTREVCAEKCRKTALGQMTGLASALIAWQPSL